MLAPIRAVLMLCVVCILVACGTATSTVPSTTLPVAKQQSTSPITPTVFVTATPTQSAISFTPDNGAPGTQITIRGVVPDPLDLTKAPSEAYVCWAACPYGLSAQQVAVEWSRTQPGHFSLAYTVPQTAWLDSDGIHALTPGDYTIGVQCLAGTREGCAVSDTLYKATFHLHEPTPTDCTPGAACSRFEVTPQQAAALSTVAIKGWLPLTAGLGSETNYVLVALERDGQSLQTDNRLDVILQAEIARAADGTVSGSFRIPYYIDHVGAFEPGHYTLALAAYPPLARKDKGDGRAVILATTTFSVTAPPSIAGLVTRQPLSISSNPGAGQEIGRDAADPRKVAACTFGKILLSSDTGTTWTALPTASLEDAILKLGYGLAHREFTPPPACRSVTLSGSSIYVTYDTVGKDNDRPYSPMMSVGFVSTDTGKTWQRIPPPNEQKISLGGGIEVEGDTIRAFFNDVGARPDEPHPLALMQTADNGRTWHEASVPCPKAGPCIRLGPRVGIYDGHFFSDMLWLNRSSDDGAHWTGEQAAQSTFFTPPIQLVAYSEREVLMVAGGEAVSLRYSADGGETWSFVGLPYIAGQDSVQGAFPGLRLVQGGSFVARTSTGWFGLTSDGRGWCAVPGVLPGGMTTEAYTVQQHSDRLWWLSDDGAPQSRPVAAIHC